MSFNPSVVNISYEKGSGIIQTANISYTFPDHVETSTPQFNGPSWLDVIFLSQQVVSGSLVYNYRVSVRSNEADNLINGNYTEIIEGSITIEKQDGGIETIIEDFTVNLEVSEVLPLELNPEQFSFNLLLGDSNPTPRSFSITSENNWSIVSDKNWVVFSTTNGNGIQTVQLGIDATGLEIGTYNATIVVDDGIFTKTATVSLTITDLNTGNQYLIINPDLIEVSENETEAPQSTGQIVIENTVTVTISTLSQWISIGDTTFAPGIHVLNFSIQNTEEFSIGTFIGEIEVSSVLGVKTSTVILRIINPETTGLVNGSFYFAKDYNKLNLSNAQNDAQAILKHRVETSGDLKIYERKVPYFQNKIAVEIGVETENLLKPGQINTSFANRFYKPFTPLKYAIEVFNNFIGQSSLALNNSFQNLYFINGRSPEDVFSDFQTQDVVKVENNKTFKRLSHLPKVIYLANDSILSFSFYASGTPSQVLISGAVNDSIPVNIDYTQVYSVDINLKNYNLNEGDVITIASNVINFTVIIKKPATESIQLIWRNEWDCLEVFNCGGTFVIKDKSEAQEVEYVKDNKIISEEFNFKNPVDFEVNTGLIYTDEEVEFLKQILHGKNIMIKRGNKIFKVLKTFRSIESFQTRKYDREFNLKFKLAEI